MKTIEPIKPDWKWATSKGSRQLDRLLDQRLTFREKLEWLEEAETLAASSQKSRSALAREHAGDPLGQWSLARHALTPEFIPQIIRRPAVARCNLALFLNCNSEPPCPDLSITLPT
jgi:hypothetical protein